MIRSLNEIVYDIIESYRATYKNTDSLDERLVATWIQHYRAELIKQRLEESMRIVDEHWVQDLGAIEMQRIDSSLVSGFASDRYIMRSAREIPPTIQTKFGIGTFTRISPADRLENKFNLVSYERALYSGNGKYNNKDVFVFLDNKYLYLMSKSNLHKYIKYIQVKGVFQNPIEAYEFVHGVNSYSWDYEYPISESLISGLKAFIKDKELRFKLTPLEDNVQNGADDIVNVNVKK